MGILTRALRVCKADVHGVMDQLEDKGLLLKQYLREMEDSLHQKVAHHGQLKMQCRQIQVDIDRRCDEIDKLEADIDMAVARSRDDIARMLIRKRRNLETTRVHLQQQFELLTEERQNLEGLLDGQRLQYDQLKIKAEAYFSQVRARPVADDFRGHDDWVGAHASTEEEIELELIQRKEALAKEGDA